MRKVEFIFKASTYSDIIGPWVDSGHGGEQNGHSFIFECDNAFLNGLAICVISNGAEYFYNLSDFYRVKITYCN